MLYLLWVQIVISQFQSVIVAKFPQDGPSSLVTTPLDEQCVEEQETCQMDKLVQSEHHGRRPIRDIKHGKLEPGCFETFKASNPTVEGEAVVLNAVAGVLPDHRLHVLQRLRGQGVHETRFLRNHVHKPSR